MLRSIRGRIGINTSCDLYQKVLQKMGGVDKALAILNKKKTRSMAMIRYQFKIWEEGED